MKKIKFISLAILCVFVNKAFPQASFIPNNSINSNHYLGWDNTVTFDLNISHFGANRNINVSTGGLIRARFDALGFVGIGQGFSTTPNSVLTLAGGNYQTGNTISPDRSLALACVWLPVR